MSRTEYEIAADCLVLLIDNGVIATDRYSDHQLAIYTGVPRHEIDRARKRLANEGRESLRPRAPEPKAKRERAERGPRSGSTDPDELARDLYVRIRKAGPFRTMAAFFAAHENDPCVGELCPVCEEPIEASQHVRIEGLVVHAEC